MSAITCSYDRYALVYGKTLAGFLGLIEFSEHPCAKADMCACGTDQAALSVPKIETPK